MTLQGEYEPSSSEWVRNHVAAFEASNGMEANTLPGTNDAIVVITSVGAHSGNLRKNPVMRVERDGSYVAIASNGGGSEDPEWAHNFRAHPVVDLQDGPSKRSFSAREASGEERASWWAHAVATWPTYAEYETKTDRTIPVFVLDPL